VEPGVSNVSVCSVAAPAGRETKKSEINKNASDLTVPTPAKVENLKLRSQHSSIPEECGHGSYEIAAPH
jgi:hypothetical protein